MEQIRGPPILCGKLYKTRSGFAGILIELPMPHAECRPALFPWELQSHFHRARMIILFDDDFS
jgi:hypothetical protein